MTNPWMSPVTLERLAAALLHFIWQGAAIALVAALALRLLRGRSAESRYAVASIALIAMLVAPLVTFAFHVETGALTLRVLRGFDQMTQAASDAAAADIAGWTQRIVSVWMIGVALLLIRLLGGWLLSRRLVRTATAVVVPAVTEALQRARAGLNFDGAVKVLSGPRVETPVVIGWLRPAILLPASALTGLSAHQLLAIVAHELAHIRRHDFLVNGLQRVVECVLFYHPAVWWVSGRIRVERERCCDDLAVGVCGDRFVYAQALVALENARAAVPALAVASTGGSVADRVRRILGVHGATHDWQSVAAAILFATILVSVGTWQPPMLATSSAGVTAAIPSAPQQSSTTPSSDSSMPATTASGAPASPAPATSVSTSLGTLLAIATAQTARTGGADAAAQAASSKVAPPAITPSREAAREKLGMLRVEYSAESFIKQAAEGDTIAIKTFLAAGMNINARGEASYTAVIKATEAGQLETVQALLAAGADPNLLGGPGPSSALSIAASAGALPIMQVLLKGGAQPDVKLTSSEETALIRAAGNSQRAAVDLLLDNKASIDAESKSRGTALVAAASVGAVEVVRTLLQRGASVTAGFTATGGTALHSTALRPNVEIVQLLLDKGADINARATDGSSPLLQMLKLATGSARVKAALPSVLFLIQRGADVNVKSNDGETPLAVATTQRMTEVVRALLDKGADPNRGKPIPPGSGVFSNVTGPVGAGPPLLVALSDRSVPESAEIALLLIERGADVNARGTSGNTPLIRALIGKYDAVVRALLAKGADPNMSTGNPGGMTPLLAAGSNEEMRKLLIEAGAKP